MGTGSASGDGLPPADDDPWAAPPPGQLPQPAREAPHAGTEFGAPAGGPGDGQQHSDRPGHSDARAPASLTLGVLGLLTSPVGLGAFPGLVAILLGLSSRRHARRSGARTSPLAVTGIVTGALALGVAGTVMFLAFSMFGPELRDYRTCLDTALTVEQKRTCQESFRSQVEQARRAG